MLSLEVFLNKRLETLQGIIENTLIMYDIHVSHHITKNGFSDVNLHIHIYLP